MGSHRMFRYLFGNAEDGALVEVVVAFGIAHRIEHDPDEAYQLVRHLLERVQESRPTTMQTSLPLSALLRVISYHIAVSYKFICSHEIYLYIKISFIFYLCRNLFAPTISTRVIPILGR